MTAPNVVAGSTPSESRPASCSRRAPSESAAPNRHGLAGEIGERGDAGAGAHDDDRVIGERPVRRPRRDHRLEAGASSCRRRRKRRPRRSRRRSAAVPARRSWRRRRRVAGSPPAGRGSSEAPPPTVRSWPSLRRRSARRARANRSVSGFASTGTPGRSSISGQELQPRQGLPSCGGDETSVGGSSTPQLRPAVERGPGRRLSRPQAARLPQAVPAVRCGSAAAGCSCCRSLRRLRWRSTVGGARCCRRDLGRRGDVSRPKSWRSIHGLRKRSAPAPARPVRSPARR